MNKTHSPTRALTMTERSLLLYVIQNADAEGLIKLHEDIVPQLCAMSLPTFVYARRGLVGKGCIEKVSKGTWKLIGTNNHKQSEANNGRSKTKTNAKAVPRTAKQNTRSRGKSVEKERPSRHKAGKGESNKGAKKAQRGKDEARETRTVYPVLQE